MEQLFTTPSKPEVQKHERQIHLIGISFVGLLLLLTLLLISLNSLAQQPKGSSAFGNLAPEADHYSRLRDASAASEGEAVDAVSFPEQDFRRKAYLNLNTSYVRVPLARFELQPFPANSSAQTRAELDFLLELQHRRSSAAAALSDSMAQVYYDPLTTDPNDPDYTRNLHSLFYIGRSLGPWFSPEQLPTTTKVLQKVLQDATYYIFSLKAECSRPRPYQLEPALQNLEAPGHAAYPSGHASASYLHAYLLSMILPEHKELFLSRAYDMSFSREVRGVHYPSDTEAGKKFAQQFVALLMKEERFQKEFKVMKAELQKAKQAHQLTATK